MGNKQNTKIPITKQIQQQTMKTDPFQPIQLSKQIRKEFSHANLNTINLQLIMKDPVRLDKESEFEKTERLKSLEKEQNKLKK